MKFGSKPYLCKKIEIQLEHKKGDSEYVRHQIRDHQEHRRAVHLHQRLAQRTQPHLLE